MFSPRQNIRVIEIVYFVAVRGDGNSCSAVYDINVRPPVTLSPGRDQTSIA
jgi:hypothetical protein